MRLPVAVALLRARLHPLARAERALRRRSKAVKPALDGCACDRCFEVWRQRMEAAHNLGLWADEMRHRWKACLSQPDPWGPPAACHESQVG